ncbi:PREDICTED: dormancy-associated protein homolog 1-like isoform X2 [Tarenaya hassleriana]|uniref:dormancy-associated protein homolog 1-like isoform X2 n=1 Tax=Tarenaya hassleriana TaxID=28532 RepID=UPI00053C6648|nr:PREDICTED: dormancy-associated protein homolog 1-like isoform X2 [Tarenaya hassleriana]
MVLLEKLWDDVVAGPQPDRGLGRLRKITTQPINIKDVGEGSSSSKMQRSMTMPSAAGSPVTPTTPTTPAGSVRKENVWRSVFHPGSNLNTKGLGANLFDKPSHPNSPTVYDWLYSGESRSQHR